MLAFVQLFNISSPSTLCLVFYRSLNRFQYAFRHPEYSMIKTTVMMIGEMEFQDLFFGTEDLTDPEELHKNKVSVCRISGHTRARCEYRLEVIGIRSPNKL